MRRSRSHPTTSQKNLIRFLSDPASYPHRPRLVKLLQTHCSYVAIVPPFVYKVKKPVNFGFLDFSTITKREFYLSRELELNRRLSTGVYLEVIPIGQRNRRLVFGAGRLMEYALKMRKLSDRYFFDRMVDRGQARKRDISRIVSTLKSFYGRQATDRPTEQWGRLEHVRKATNDNFKLTTPFIGRSISPVAFDTIKSFTNRFYHRHRSLFAKRVNERRIRDCHGDLHLEHIHLGPKSIQIYDCIEFNERLRHIDVANDIAFLAMDLDFHGRPDLSHYFVERMSRALKDPEMHQLMNLYKCYRAYVRGKVECLRSAETEPSPEERRRSLQQARRYFQLALGYVIAGSRPMVLLTMGRIASGKSTLAEALGGELNWPVASSDITRKTLANFPLTTRPNPTDRTRLYSRIMTARTYKTLYHRATKLAAQGKSIIIDATFSRSTDREQFRNGLIKNGIHYAFVEATTPRSTIRTRLKQRPFDPTTVSDARLEDLKALDQLYEPPKEIPREHFFTVTTSGAKDETLRRTLRKLMKRKLGDS